MHLEWKLREAVKVDGPNTVFEIVRKRGLPKKREVFLVLLLNAKNKVERVACVSIGTLTASLVHPREVFRGAILHGAASIILAHNHPSGDPTPSREDIEITERLAEGGKLLGIDLLDHVIVGTEGRFESLRESGHL